MKTAFITGICGQDGSYLAELLLEKGYKVIGLYRRTSSPNFDRIKHIKDRLVLVEGDVTDYSSLSSLIFCHNPNEIYNLAAQSHVKSSFEQPFYTTNVDYIGCLNILEAIRELERHWTVNREWQFDKLPKFYQASTSEMYGSMYTTEYWTFNSSNIEYTEDKNHFAQKWHGVKKYQNEDTSMKPNSPYAIAKLAAHNAVRLYRESYGIFACSGILFNHESERRGPEFVTKKITDYIRKYLIAPSSDYVKFEKLKLGNLDASRDWGHAEDYVRGMWLMLQQDKPDDYVLATGETHTVKEFLSEAFLTLGLDWQDYVEIDNNFKRPCEVPYLCGNATKAKEKLGWEPKIKFKELVRRMMRPDAQA